MKGTRPDSNLTGGQIQQILDKLLYDSVHLLLPYGLLDETLIYILSSALMDKRRKILSIEYNKGVNILCNLVIHNSQNIFEDLKQLKLERTIYIKVLNCFLATVKDSNYLTIYSEWLITRSPKLDKELSDVEKKLGIPRDKLIMIYYNIEYNLHEFMMFKTSIVRQFINLAHKYTSIQVKTKNKNLSYDDLFQNIVTSISKAIDKYDSSKGALTSYIKYWIINAQKQDNSNSGGLAYEISQTYRLKVAKKEVSDVNFSSSLNDNANKIISTESSPEQITEEKDSTNKILRLIKIADTDGIFRLVNNIDEFFTVEEMTKMKEHMESELKKFQKSTL